MNQAIVNQEASEELNEDKQMLERVFRLGEERDLKNPISQQEQELKKRFAELYQGNFDNFDEAIHSNCILEAQ